MAKVAWFLPTCFLLLYLVVPIISDRKFKFSLVLQPPPPNPALQFILYEPPPLPSSNNAWQAPNSQVVASTISSSTEGLHYLTPLIEGALNAACAQRGDLAICPTKH